MVQTFVRGLSEQTKYYRYMQAIKELTPEMLVRFTQIDYDREMAFVATVREGGREAEIGVARYVTNPFTVGIPVPGREPVLLDYATSAIAMERTLSSNSVRLSPFVVPTR